MKSKIVISENNQTTINTIKYFIKKILNYCDLEWDDSCLQHHKNFKTPIATVSLTEARKPIYKSSVNFSKNYSDHLAGFFAKLDKK